LNGKIKAKGELTLIKTRGQFRVEYIL
jgi:hypothetical protein